MRKWERQYPESGEYAVKPDPKSMVPDIQTADVTADRETKSRQWEGY